MDLPLSEGERAAYRALMRVVLAAPRAVGADIATECGLALSEHLALEALSEASGQRMRITELAFARGISVSGATRIVGRLTDEGLAARVRSSRDARGAEAVLTEAGQSRLKRAQQAHLASVRRHIFDHLGEVDLACLSSRLDRIADSMVMGHAPGRHRPVLSRARGTSVAR
jgi:DNA-binding MarR family transcriptional regulator